ncbi:CCA tRNA nucleotidyltransferase [Lactonifactor longoviformis]|uniref:CCA tRNA nucleotidyltransferase n=1 Tax=Lactonifactor longoviformis TaxID=341220 RepID=UPI00210E0533|nr:CCA tRNA nucleotidyltransferase [Lactonifactor longoviformis]MCQ4673162.1 CCA tRNA nucleotidyltransferase [Lactonifactor longoviformis]
MQIDMPKKVESIIETLNSHGYEAYAVGGCVRDTILGRTPDDWDITTSARPEEVKKIFGRTVDTGLVHGTVTVMIGKEGFEVTTYRIDGAYEDNRHPLEVTFTPSLTEDLKRRDFTINAMAYNHRDGLIDIFDGIGDLEKKRIRCVGEPLERFQEDALRMLRAVRFSAQLGFSIESGTREGVKLLAPNLKAISAERIQTELVKLIVSDHPEMLREAFATGMTKQFLPEFDSMMETTQNNPHHKYSVGEHVIRSMEYVENIKILRLTMLLHDVGKPMVKTTDEEGIDHFKTHNAVGEKLAGEILRRLKFDNDTIAKVSRLVKWHDYWVQPKYHAVRRAVNKVGEELYPYLLKVQRADALAQSNYQQEEKLRRLDEVEEMYQHIIEEKQCVSLKDLAVTGRDLIQCGMKPGKAIGEELNRLLELVLEEPERNQRDFLLQVMREDLKRDRSN